MGDKKQSDDLYKLIQDSTDKFEYFIPTVAGALFAYVGQHYEPRQLELNWTLLEPITLLLLGASFWLGVSRLQNMLLIRKANYRHLTIVEDMRVYTATIVKLNEGQQTYDTTTG